MGFVNPSWLTGPRRICLEKKVTQKWASSLFIPWTPRGAKTLSGQCRGMAEGKPRAFLHDPPQIRQHWLPCMSACALIFHCLTALNLRLLSTHWWHRGALLLLGHHPSPGERRRLRQPHLCTRTSTGKLAAARVFKFSLYFTKLVLIAGAFPAGCLLQSNRAFEAAVPGSEGWALGSPQLIVS